MHPAAEKAYSRKPGFRCWGLSGSVIRGVYLLLASTLAKELSEGRYEPLGALDVE